MKERTLEELYESAVNKWGTETVDNAVEFGWHVEDIEKGWIVSEQCFEECFYDTNNIKECYMPLLKLPIDTIDWIDDLLVSEDYLKIQQNDRYTTDELGEISGIVYLAISNKEQVDYELVKLLENTVGFKGVILWVPVVSKTNEKLKENLKRIIATEQ